MLFTIFCPSPGPQPRGITQATLKCNISSFVRRHTKFGLKIFEIDFVIEFNDIDPFLPLPRAPGGGTKNHCAVACPLHVSNSHTKFGWILSNGLVGDSVADGRTNLLAPPQGPRGHGKNFYLLLHTGSM